MVTRLHEATVRVRLRLGVTMALLTVTRQPVRVRVRVRVRVGVTVALLTVTRQP